MKAKEYRKIIQKSPDKNTPCYNCSNEEISWCMQNGLKKNAAGKLYADACGRFDTYATVNKEERAKDTSKVERPVKPSGKVVIKKVPEKLKIQGKWS